MPTIRVRDLMSSQVSTVSAKDSLADVYDLFDSLHIRHVPVTDDNDELVGLVSHRDLAKNALHAVERLPMSSQRELLSILKVDEVMARDPETIDPEAPIEDAASTMLENKFGCLPVTEGDRLVGILTEADFVKYVRESLEG